ncbi:Nitrite reductase [anaerobic digester metagenome]
MADKIVGDAVIQRDGTSYGLMVGGAGGVVTPEELERIARIAREHAVPLIKLTRGQRIALLGIPPGEVAAVARAVGIGERQIAGPCLKYVAACPGTTACKWGMQDALGLARVLEERIGARPLPSKLKIGVSGCTRNCSASFACDLGFIGSGRGWMVFFGGNGARRPRNADLVASNLSDDQALDLARRLVDYYAANARAGERTARFVERVGLETVRADLLRFVPYLPLEGTETG